MFRLTLCLLWACNLSAAPIERIWLTHACNDVHRITINWETELPTPSVVEHGETAALGRKVVLEELATLHHLEIPLQASASRHHYRVRSGADVSAIHSFKGYTGQELRVGIFADRGYARDRDEAV